MKTPEAHKRSADIFVIVAKGNLSSAGFRRYSARLNHLFLQPSWHSRVSSLSEGGNVMKKFILSFVALTILAAPLAIISNTAAKAEEVVIIKKKRHHHHHDHYWRDHDRRDYDRRW